MIERVSRERFSKNRTFEGGKGMRNRAYLSNLPRAALGGPTSP